MKRLKPPSTSRSSRKIHRITFKDRLLLILIVLIVLQCLLPFLYFKIDIGSFLADDYESIPPFRLQLSNATLDRLSSLEQEVGNILNSRVVACRSPRGQSICVGNTKLVWYNPSSRDKFLCGRDILLAPGMTLQSEKMNVEMEKCWRNPMEMSLTSHSFPMEATVYNKADFPG